ncbi:hypothetical protein [Vibrio coralliilyticus]|uniref:hypothetical protein n=1 Tax=Vibrio coralliilyticus TaxID=190893 RepID=UPI000C16C64E|nr:hypothetical protein [Vibrio coralliilyticus]HAT8493333.1 hypothetical protein [Vibrio vulnificus]HDY8016185.1 hypothetical protein [Vibrio vulnificus]HDZ3733824.1 hypothetical protein [Vibrio harveyi]
MKLAFTLAIIGWIVSLFTAWTDLAGYSTSLELFGRSGAVLTLLGASLEYKLVEKGLRNTQYEEGGPISLGAVGRAVLLTDNEKKIRHFAHTTVILGTFIWGFGDLISLL